MGDSTNVIMIVSQSEAAAKEAESLARSMLAGCKVHFAKDANEVLFKLQNVVPSVLITDLELNKYYPGTKLIQTLLKDKRFASLRIIVTAAAPKGEFCVNEVASGQVQFVPRPVVPEQFQKALQRAVSRNSGATPAMEFRQRTLKPGELLFCEGENADTAFLLKSGKLQAFRSRIGQKHILGEILPGEFVGEMAYIDGEPRSASVEAVSESELVEIPLASLDSIVFSKPAWSKALLKTLSKRLKLANVKGAA